MALLKLPHWFLTSRNYACLGFYNEIYSGLHMLEEKLLDAATFPTKKPSFSELCLYIPSFSELCLYIYIYQILRIKTMWSLPLKIHHEIMEC